MTLEFFSPPKIYTGRIGPAIGHVRLGSFFLETWTHFFDSQHSGNVEAWIVFIEKKMRTHTVRVQIREVVLYADDTVASTPG
jgi:hypothetical protein